MRHELGPEVVVCSEERQDTIGESGEGPRRRRVLDAVGGGTAAGCRGDG